jgi:hypothetical protein
LAVHGKPLHPSVEAAMAVDATETEATASCAAAIAIWDNNTCCLAYNMKEKKKKKANSHLL